MNTLSVAIIIISGITNMIADVLLVSGRDYSKKDQTKEERAQNTPNKHIELSGILGLISIIFWTAPLYYLSKLTTTIGGTVAMISFAIFIITLATFHAVCAYSILCYKYNNDAKELVTKTIKSYGMVSIIFSSIYTFSMIYLSLNGILKMNILHYFTLPLFSMIIVQFILGALLKRIPHFSSVAGTLGMIISLLGTVNIMIINNIG